MGIVEVTSFALCSANTDAVVEAQDFVVPAGQSAGDVATCPAGTRAVGGGVGHQVPGTVLELSGPLDETGLTANTGDGDVARSWFAYVFNGTNAVASYKAFALCSKDSDAIVEATVFGAGQAVSNIGRATCPDGRRALGGGIGTNGSVAVSGPVLPFQSILSHPADETGVFANTQNGDVARGWQGAVFNQSGALESFKVLALCARDPGATGPGGPNGPGPGDGTPRPRCGGKRATIVGTAKKNRLRGTRRADVIVGLGGNDVIRAGRGNDLVCSGSGNDVVEGGPGNDRLLGGSGRDRLVGGDGRDRLTGNSGRDRCLGGPGRDRAACERKKWSMSRGATIGRRSATRGRSR